MSEMRDGIVKRGKDSYAFVVELGRDANGKRRQKWVTVRGSRKDAKRERDRMRVSRDEGIFVEPSRMTVGQYLESWLTNYAASNVSGKTLERYGEIVRSFLIPKIGSYTLPKLQPLHIQDCYTKALESGRVGGGKLSARTVLHYHRVLNEALSRAVKWRLLVRNPAEAVEPPRAARREMVALSDEQTATLLQLVRGRRTYMPALLAITTGMRRGEVCGLRWSDVDLELRTLAVRQSLEQTKGGLHFKQPKTAKGSRNIALPSLAVEALRTHKIEQAKERLLMGPGFKDHGLVICNLDGTPYPPDSLTNTFSSMVRRIGKFPKGFNFHSLRHTHATSLLRQGVHPKIVSERLGHSTVSITLDTYSHVMPGMQEDAAQKMDAALRAAMRS